MRRLRLTVTLRNDALKRLWTENYRPKCKTNEMWWSVFGDERQNNLFCATTFDFLRKEVISQEHKALKFHALRLSA